MAFAPTSLYRLLPVIFALSAAIEAAQADTVPSCTVYVADAQVEKSVGWEKLGYRVEERADLAVMPNQDLAKLLKTGSFAIRRSLNPPEMQFSLTDGRGGPNWIPLSVAAPALNSFAGELYRCEALLERMGLFAEARHAVLDVFSLIHGRPIARTHGEARLDLERAALEYQMRYDLTRPKVEAKSEYLKILASAKHAFENSYAPDFFQKWLTVTSAIYGDEGANVDYCRDNRTMTQAMINKCTNCEGETYLLFSLFEDLRVSPPAGWVLATQAFADHLRLVLYNPKEQKTFDLSTGGFGTSRAIILDTVALDRALWRFSTAFRHPIEQRQVAALKPAPLYVDFQCLFSFTGLYAGKEAVIDFSDVTSCDRFAKQEPPEHADNSSRAKQQTFDENQPQTTAQGSKKPSEKKEESGQGDAEATPPLDPNALPPRFRDGEGSGEALKPRTAADEADPLTKATSMFSTMFGTPEGKSWFGYKEGYSTDEGYAHSIEMLEDLAANLIPSEAADLYRTLEEKNFGLMTEKFSVASLVSRLGYPQLYTEFKEEPDYWTWDSVVLPIYVTNKMLASSEQKVGLIYQGPELPAVAMSEESLFYVGREFLFKNIVYVSSPGLGNKVNEWERLSTPERIRAVTQQMADFRDDILNGITRTPGFQSQDVEENLKALHEEFWFGFGDTRMGENQLEWGRRWVESFDRVIAPSGLVLPQESTYPSRTKNQGGPVREAVRRILNVEGATPAFLEMVAFAERLEKNPVANLKYIESLNEDQRRMFLLNINILGDTMKQLAAALSGLGTVDQKILDRYALGRTVMARMLSSLLKHPKYFFTVEPERDEVLPMRPLYPKRLDDPRVADQAAVMKKADLPEINLPQLPGTEDVCAEMGPGYVELYGGAFIVECKGKEGDRTAAGSPEAVGEGLTQTQQPAMAASAEVSGEGDLAVPGSLREGTEGRDPNGELILKKDLSKKEWAYLTSPELEELRKGKAKLDNPESFFDPREEVHVDPSVWEALLITTAQSKDPVLTEPVTKILLHHVFRRKLAETFKKLKRESTALILNPLDLEENVLIMPEKTWIDTSTYMSNNWAEIAEASKKLDRYEGIGQTEFFKAALDEVKAGPKKGYVVFTSKGYTESTETQLKIMKAVYPGSKGDNEDGKVFPLVIKMEGSGVEYSAAIPGDRKFMGLGEYAESLIAIDDANDFERLGIDESFLHIEESPEVDVILDIKDERSSGTLDHVYDGFSDKVVALTQTVSDGEDGLLRIAIMVGENGGEIITADSVNRQFTVRDRQAQ